ncbi:MAG: type II/IV secretion system ATPase subunit [Methanoregula sp.]|nr:type II/IV secretion system ATPase subunit [Methanoregula sp.]
MIQNFLVTISCMFTLIGLNGLFTTLKNRMSVPKDPLPPVTEPLPRSSNPQKELPCFDLPTIRAASEKFLSILAAPTWQGVISLATVIVATLVSAFIVMFIDLPLPTMIALSLIALAATGLSVITIRRRHFFGAWLPSGILGKTGDPVPVPDPTDYPVAEESTDPLHAADIPGQASLATLERYWVVEPYSYVKIERFRNEGFTYIVVEPTISQKEKTILMETYAHLRDIIIYDNTEKSKNERIDPVAVARIIRQFDPDITEDRVEILKYYIDRDLSGYGPLEVLMRDPALEDLSCNGHDLPVFIFHRAYGSLPTSIFFTESELNQFVLKLAQKANKQMSLSNPMVDATLPNGARIQITYSAVVSTKGSSFTIRKFRAEPMTPLDLIRFGTYNAQTLAFLWLAIEHRKSLLVVGGTASGKTSMMNAVSLFIPQNAKVVSLEDTREIQLPHRNWLPTQTRELNVEGIKGDIDLFSLLKACMRQRPEYIIVGEVRGVEAQTLFQAMNSGHATLSTIHAGSVHEAINRLTHDPINVPAVMFQALDLVVVQSIYTLGKTRIRRCLSIHEIEVTKHGEINAIPMFEWDIQNDTFRRVSHKSKVLNEIAFHCGWDAQEMEHQLKKREEFFSWALEVEPPTLRDLANAIHDLGD